MGITTSLTPLRVAVASSGLGHISRGIEAWAADTALALHRTGRCAVTLFQGAGEAREPWQRTLPCKRRFDPDVQNWVKWLRKVGGWRLGLGSGYEMEQATFTFQLWKHIRRGYDILHVQDPRIALLMEYLHRRGLSQPRVILAHGTEETPAFLSRFSYLQHLAPCYLEENAEAQSPRQAAFAIPNFVNTQVFQPGDQAAARRHWQLPKDALVVLCVAALKKHHKRIDALLYEYSHFADRFHQDFQQEAILVVAGARETETEEIIALGHRMLGDRVRILEGIRRDEIPLLYQAADIFAMASLHEMLPIAMLEALATGLPIACNATPTLQWIVGDAGAPNDIAQAHNLSGQLMQLASPEARLAAGRNARRRALSLFSEEVVIDEIRRMYDAVAGRLEEPQSRAKAESDDRH